MVMSNSVVISNAWRGVLICSHVGENYEEDIRLLENTVLRWVVFI